MEKESPLSTFISSERERFETEDNNKFAFSFSQISRYGKFTNMIFGRYKKVSEQFIANAKAKHQSFLPGPHKVSDAQSLPFDKSPNCRLLVHFNIERSPPFTQFLFVYMSH